MNVSIALPAMAPQSTGHPASLPPDPVAPTAAQKVIAPASGGQSSGANMQNPSAEDERPAAPPSAMQIKIMEILEQQARDLDQDTGGDSA